MYLQILTFFNRKNLYHDLYEYDNPLFYRGVGKFEIIPAAESDLENPWKESFKQLYRGIHVRSGQAELIQKNPKKYCGRSVVFHNTIEQAITCSEEMENCIIFIHSGHYNSDYLVIDSNITLIGAGMIFYCKLTNMI